MFICGKERLGRVGMVAQSNQWSHKTNDDVSDGSKISHFHCMSVCMCSCAF